MTAAPARAELVGLLELPDGFASGASNVQGWAFTNTPNASLTPPFSVLINGVEAMKIGCCATRGDIPLLHPEAPPETGFSAVYNWGLTATAAAADAVSDPQGIALPTQIFVQVVVTDDMGGLNILSKTVDLWHPTSFPRSKLAEWTIGIQATDTPQGVIIVPSGGPSECILQNTSDYTLDAAELFCTNLNFIAPDDSIENCALVRFSWEKGSQSFKLTSDCLPGVQ